MGVRTKDKDFVHCVEVRDVVNTNVVVELFKATTVACVGFLAKGGPASGGGKPG